MSKIEDLFKAIAKSPYETAMLENGNVGFRIPEYQREYRWSKVNIERLFTDCLIGFYELGTNPDNASAFTFLGTLILVNEDNHDKDFNGHAIGIVDGQQRLTTLTLIACALHERLNISLKDLETLQLYGDIQNWLQIEIEGLQSDLLKCAVGVQMLKGGKTYPYSRITRSGDARAKTFVDSEYDSPLGKFLFEFGLYAGGYEDKQLPTFAGDNRESVRFRDNFKCINEMLTNMHKISWYEKGECQLVDEALFDRKGYKNLLDHLNQLSADKDEQTSALNKVKMYEPVHNIFRTILFSAYFCRCIVLTCVRTNDENAAFDIFDALNTTGEPLTAIETLKPKVIQFEQSQKRTKYDNSISAFAFSRIHENIDEQFSDNSRRQRESKELIVSFALIIAGEKLSLQLSPQRRFLRDNYDIAKKTYEEAQRFVTTLADLSEFRRYYWRAEGIDELVKYHPSPDSNDDLDQIQLLMSFLKDTKTSLVLPILARYWKPDLRDWPEESGKFLEALKAVTAFLVLRRAVTGGTAGIDSRYRSVMDPNEFGLCAGIGKPNDLRSIDELKGHFRDLLANDKNKVDGDKNDWIDKVAYVSHYTQATEIARFMLLCAAHQSIPSDDNPGCWKKEDYVAETSNNFLNFNMWKKGLYKTVEHIAPQDRENSKEGWSDDIYENSTLIHTLGNLTLLTKEANSSIGNECWKKKRIFYKALAEKSSDEQQRLILDANVLGVTFTDYTTELMAKQERFDLLRPLGKVETWSKEVIIKRTRNIAGLVWDELWPWLE